MARVAIVFPHVGYCTGFRPHLSREVSHGATYHVAQCLTYLYSTARLFSDEVEVYDFNFGDAEMNLSQMDAFAPDVVLISTTVNSYDSTRDLVVEINRRHPIAQVFVGGPAVSSNLASRRDLLQINGRCDFIPTHKNIFAWTERVFGRKAEVTFDNFAPDNGWIAATYGKEIGKLRFTTIASLGCTYKCNFCLNPKVYAVEYKDPEVLRGELSWLMAKHGVDKVSVADPYFFMSFEHAHRVMRVFADLGLPWSQQTCLVTLTDRNLEAMAETGCDSVLVGIENFATGEIDKPVGQAKLEDRILRAKSLGIKIKPSFISGLLDIDYAVDVDQINYIARLVERGLIENTQIQANIYTPYIPDSRDRLLDVPFRFWGILPVTAQNVDDWKDKLGLCDLIYERIFPETLAKYREVRAEYLDAVRFEGDPWLNIPAPAALPKIDLAHAHLS